MSTEAVTVTTTVGDRERAARLARSAVAARLAACAQVGPPVTSVYWWEGALEDAEEWPVTFKTATDRADALVAHLAAAHPYDVPEILVLPVAGGHQPYLTWLAEETRSRDGA